MSDTIAEPMVCSALNENNQQLIDKGNDISLKVSVASVSTMKNKTKCNNSRTELTRNNDLLAKRLNKKKEEAKMLRNKLKRVTSDTIKYRQAINHLMQQRKKLHLKLGQVGQNVASLNELLAVMKNEGIKLKKDLDSLVEYNSIDDLENMSYLANTTLMTDLQKTKTASAGKTPKKVVNMVRPMKCGYVVGNPVVSLRRLKRQPGMVTRPVLPVVPEDSDGEDSNAEVTTPADASSNDESSDTSDSSRDSTPEPPKRTRLRGRPVPVSSPPDLEEDSITSVRSAPKGRSKLPAARSSNVAIRKSAPLVNSPAQARPRKAQPTRRAIKGTSPNKRTTYVVTDAHPVQLRPCHVLMKDIMNTRSTNTTASPLCNTMMPVVLLDRVTTRHKRSSLVPDPTTDIEEQPEPESEVNTSTNTEVIPMEITKISDVPIDKPEENGTQMPEASRQKTSGNMETITEESAEFDNSTFQVPDAVAASDEQTPNIDMSKITIRQPSADKLNIWTSPNDLSPDKADTSDTPNARRSIVFDNANNDSAEEKSPNSEEDDTLNNTVTQKTNEGQKASPNQTKKEAHSPKILNNLSSSQDNSEPKTDDSDNNSSDVKSKTSPLNTTYTVVQQKNIKKIKPMPKSIKMKKIQQSSESGTSDNEEHLGEATPHVGKKEKKKCCDDERDDDYKPKKESMQLSESPEDGGRQTRSMQSTLAESEGDLTQGIRKLSDTSSKGDESDLSVKQAKKRKSKSSDDEEDVDNQATKKVAYENLVGEPESLNTRPPSQTSKRTRPCPASKKVPQSKSVSKPYKARNKKSTAFSNSCPTKPKNVDAESQDSLDSNLSTSSNSLSSEERSAFMMKFMERVKKEDPLEGTSKKFETKKKNLMEKAGKANSSPQNKKHTRIHKKIQYTESPSTPKIKKAKNAPKKKKTGSKPTKKSKKHSEKESD